MMLIFLESISFNIIIKMHIDTSSLFVNKIPQQMPYLLTKIKINNVSL